MAAIDLLAHERDLAYTYSDPHEERLGSIMQGREADHVLDSGLYVRSKGQIVPTFKRAFPLGILPVETVIHHNKHSHPVIITHNFEENSLHAWETLSIQDITRDSLTRVVSTVARDLLIPSRGDYAGKIVGEVHRRPDECDNIDPRFVRPFREEDLAWFESLTHALESLRSSD